MATFKFQPCAVWGCVSWAQSDGRCVVHRDYARESYQTTCHVCTKPILARAWHRKIGDERRHTPTCPKPKDA